MEKKCYEVQIVCTYRITVEVDAYSKAEAYDKVYDDYVDGKIEDTDDDFDDFEVYVTGEWEYEEAI